MQTPTHPQRGAGTGGRITWIYRIPAARPLAAHTRYLVRHDSPITSPKIKNVLFLDDIFVIYLRMCNFCCIFAAEYIEELTCAATKSHILSLFALSNTSKSTI